MATKVKPIPDGFHTATPYLLVNDGDKQIAFLKRAFGAAEVHVSRHPGGSFMHGEVKIGDSMIMIGQSRDNWKAMPAMIYLYVEDVDRTFRQAISAGGKTVREVKTEFYGDRSGGVEDLCGNTWWISTHVEDVSHEELERRFAAMGQQH
ncbi:MAG TPA: VOC family protein [Bryobacteraceae bacterium]